MIQSIWNKVEQNKRIDLKEILVLAKQASLHDLAKHANWLAKQKNGNRVAFLIDRNINYTNICLARCAFCAFYRPAKHKEGYDLSFEEIDQKISETLQMGGSRILLQGGLHPDHTLNYYVSLVSHIKKNHPIHIHAFSPPEIHHVATQAGVSYHEALMRLKQAGLGSIPGGGAEILVESVRAPISVGQCNVEEWLTVMKTAHKAAIKTTATMMMGHLESWEDRVEHLDRLRSLQDETRGFLSFIPWSFQPENTALHPKLARNNRVHLASAYEYLRLLAIARIYLDNFDHIQVSLLTQGQKVAQIGLSFGADDLGSLLIEENVVRLAGKPQEADLERHKMVRMIKDTGRIPFERDTFYNEIKRQEEPLVEARVVGS